jgi:hypothetical protein
MNTKVKIGAIVAAGALAVTGTAAAAGAGPGAGIFGGHDDEFAKDLAQQLPGVSAGDVSDALDAVEEQRHQERIDEMAKGIAEQLDGVSADEVAKVLSKYEEQVHKQAGSGERPDQRGERPDQSGLVTALAEGLDLSEDEVTQALEAARDAAMEEHKAEALKRLDEAVANGDVTSEQADQIRERIENGQFGPGGPGGHGPGGPMAGGPEGGPPPGLGGPRGQDQGTSPQGQDQQQQQQDGASYGVAPATASSV